MALHGVTPAAVAGAARLADLCRDSVRCSPARTESSRTTQVDVALALDALAEAAAEPVAA